MLEQPILLLKATQKNKTASKHLEKKSELLSEVIKDNFASFLNFVYPDADKVVDFSKEIHFMDTEPLSDEKDGQNADLMAKLHLKNGAERWITLNIGIEEVTDPDLAYYTFQYDYRIQDQYGTAPITISFLTGKGNEHVAISYSDEHFTFSIAPILFYKIEKENPWQITIRSL
uniref:hypothetical protein n=1 Tax=Pedobacter schmidteae TaxID=2201271 RepID=UPI000EAE809A|nr:hypothetical protein [Pedobacter schmidteae]